MLKFIFLNNKVHYKPTSVPRELLPYLHVSILHYEQFA